MRVGEESTTTFPSSSSSSTSHRVGAESTVTGGEQRGEKRAAEDPPADCGQEDSVGQNEELRAGDGTSMECLSFQEYCDSGGLWMIACREPEENLEETQDEAVPIATEQNVLQGDFWDDRTGKLLDSEKVRAAGQKSVESSIAECGLKLTLKSVGTRKEEGP